jgi:hypothetical protein
MATALKKLTGMGGDVQKIARLLQAKAPEGHMLAYITPEEASVLKQRGGSGRPHADTGIPSYQQEDFDMGPPISAAEIEGPPISAAQQDTFQLGSFNVPAQTGRGYSFTGDTGLGFQMPQGPSQGLDISGVSPETVSDFGPQINIPSPTYALGSKFTGDIGAPEPKEEGAFDKLSKSTGLSRDTLARLGIAGVTGLLGRSQAERARESGQEGRQEIEAVAAPYRQQGLQLQAQAQRGELTPQAQQSLQAVQAQAAQQAQRRGGVGVAQSQQQIENFRQQLLAQQYDLGLKISGIGDQIALGAIRTGMQADNYVNQLTSSYYTNIARVLYGVAPETAQQQRGA